MTSEGQDGSAPRRGRRTADAPAGRDALLRAATRCFADNGFEAASTVPHPMSRKEGIVAPNVAHSTAAAPLVPFAW